MCLPGIIVSRSRVLQSRRAPWIASRGRTPRVPARNVNPPTIGARTLPYTPGNAILTGTRENGSAADPAGTWRVPGNLSVAFSPCFSVTRTKFKWEIVRTTVVVYTYPKQPVITVLIVDSIRKAPIVASSCISPLRVRVIP